jgi:hypothetical protein
VFWCVLGCGVCVLVVVLLDDWCVVIWVGCGVDSDVWRVVFGGCVCLVFDC